MTDAAYRARAWRVTLLGCGAFWLAVAAKIAGVV